jgi:prepilin-type N-terminal cleavage/methylation domain-containing protein
MSRLRRGVTLIETLLAVAIATLASAALLLAVESALSTATDAADRTIADGLAQQLLDEISQKRYVEPGVSAISTSLGTDGTESSQPGRSGYDDVDDYASYSAAPLVGLYGETLGSGDDANGQRLENFRLPTTWFGRWRRKASVYYVDATTLQRLSSGTSYFRCIEVTVEQKDASDNYLPLVTKRRVIAYVPPTSS